MATFQRFQLINLTNVNTGVFEPLKQRINQMKASIKKMTNAFWLSLPRDWSTA